MHRRGERPPGTRPSALTVTGAVRPGTRTGRSAARMTSRETMRSRRRYREPSTTSRAPRRPASSTTGRAGSPASCRVAGKLPAERGRARLGPAPGAHLGVEATLVVGLPRAEEGPRRTKTKTGYRRAPVQASPTHGPPAPGASRARSPSCIPSTTPSTATPSYSRRFCGAACRRATEPGPSGGCSRFESVLTHWREDREDAR